MDNGAGSYRRYLDGDDNGIIEIIRDYKDGLILFLNRYVHNIHVAEELAEDTFVRIVTRRPRFTESHSFKTWLYTIGRNLAVSYLRYEGKTAAVPAEDLERLADDEATLEQTYLRRERRIQVHRALARVRSDYAAALYLKYFEELSNEQIARVTGKRKRQVENLLYQAKRALRAELEKEGISDEGLS